MRSFDQPLTAGDLIRELEKLTPETLVLVSAQSQRWEVEGMSEPFALDDAEGPAPAVTLIAGEWH